MISLKKTDNLLNLRVPYFALRRYLHKIPMYNIIPGKKLVKLQQTIFNAAKLINFNKSKFNNLVLN
jgi:hypothetical protein